MLRPSTELETTALRTPFTAVRAVVAGTADGTPAPSPSPGSLVSHTGSGSGEFRLGAATDYATCDYGETSHDVLTCDIPVHIGGLAAAPRIDSALGPVPPCYDHDSDACADSFHFVKDSTAPLGVTTNGSCANGTWCTLTNADITFTGSNAVFVSPTYACALSSTSSYLINLFANDQTTIGFEIQVYNSSGSAIPSNADLGLTYACFGV